MAFDPTPAERDPKNWTPDQQQAWLGHQQEQAARGLPPFPPEQFMLVQHNKFGLKPDGTPDPTKQPSLPL